MFVTHLQRDVLAVVTATTRLKSLQHAHPERQRQRPHLVQRALLSLPERRQRLHDPRVDVLDRQVAYFVEQRHQADFAVNDGQLDVVRAQFRIAVEQFVVDVAQVTLEAVLVVDVAAVVDPLHAVDVAADARHEPSEVLETSQVVALLVVPGPGRSRVAAHPAPCRRRDLHNEETTCSHGYRWGYGFVRNQLLVHKETRLLTPV